MAHIIGDIVILDDSVTSCVSIKIYSAPVSPRSSSTLSEIANNDFVHYSPFIEKRPVGSGPRHGVDLTETFGGPPEGAAPNKTLRSVFG